MTAWGIEALLASAALLALVLVARVPVRAAFGPTVAYGLWAIPALRLLLPPLPAGWAPQTAAPLATASEQVSLLILPELAPTAQPATIAGPMLVVVWAVGALLVLGWHLLAYARFTRAVKAAATPIGRIGRVALVASDDVTGPLAFGVLNPVVAVPSDFELCYSDAERGFALAHELAHHRRGDIAANWLALVMLSLQWFNPLAWLALGAFRADQELAADAHVLARRDAAERHTYACAIVKAAGARIPVAALGLHSAADLKGRLRMLAVTTTRGRIVAGTAIVAGATLALLGLTASGSRAADTVRERVESATGVPLEALAPAALLQVAAPVPPTPAAPSAPVKKVRSIHVVKRDGADRVTVTEDGQTRHLEGAEAEAWIADHPVPAPPAPPMPPIPAVPGVAPVPPTPPVPPAMAWSHDIARAAAHAGEAARRVPTVVAGDCRREPDGVLSAEQMVIRRTDGGRRTILICANRIAAAARSAELAALDADRVGREAMRHALESLRRTRATLSDTRMPGLTGAQRAEALRGIDESIAELEREGRD